MRGRCKQRKLSTAEASTLASFSCLNAQCFKPSDRAMLLGFIRKEWGSEEIFDKFVRTELVQVMGQSKATYQAKLRDNAIQSFECVFGD